MHCPYCDKVDSKVTDSRVVENGVRRRRECQACGVRFTTYERVQSNSLMVTKRDGRREEFDREKVISGIRKACTKRPVPSRTIEKIVEEIEAELPAMGHADVPTSVVGSMVMDRLRHLDEVAYIRWASVYRNFEEIESFERAVQDLREDTQLPLLEDAPPPKRRTRRRVPAGATQTRSARNGANRSSDADQDEESPAAAGE